MRRELKLRIWDVLKAAGNRLASNTIHSCAAFREIIEKEQGRVCRNHHYFTVVVFNFFNGNGSGENSRRLIGILKERVRYTDEVGWINGHEVGVLLPETDSDGATCFAEDVRQAMTNPGSAPSYRLFVYPQNNNHNGDDPKQLWFDSILPKERPASSRARSSAADQRLAHTTGEPSAWAPPGPVETGDGMGSLLAARPPPLKRALDVFLGVVCLVLFAPLMLLIGVVIKVVSPGPVLFKQVRVGYLGKTFQCLKLRSMHVESNSSLHRQHLRSLINSDQPMTKLDEKEDPRIIPVVGPFLRKSGLDELPQLINVLRGEMSLIGPRPCIPYEYEDYELWHKHRVYVLPGLTGLWQVKGKNRTTFTEMMRLDIAYRRKHSLWMDIRILLATVPTVLAQMRGGSVHTDRSVEL
jgi:lipopolysaccharide/colanic/teichoic acid biosynthesis glycosyltransferase